MANSKSINFVEARELVAAHQAKKVPEAGVWPKRCATARVLFENTAGDIAKTDLYISIEIDENGQFNTQTRNPVVIHNAPGGIPRHEYCYLQVKDQRTKVRPWMDEMMSAFAVELFDVQIPAQEETPEEAKSQLASPANVEMPT